MGDTYDAGQPAFRPQTYPNMYKQNIDMPSNPKQELRSPQEIRGEGPDYKPREPYGFTIKDSGQRQDFASGMVRDVTTGKEDFELPLNGPMFDRWAAHLTKGAVKYPDAELGVPNWTLANGREELVRFRKSAVRHFRQWLRGDQDEDHAAAVFFNINGYEYVKARMACKT